MSDTLGRQRSECTHPHGDGRILEFGARLDNPGATVILLHGRGSSATDIGHMAPAISPDTDGETIAWLAPQAAHNTWYPRRFIEPIERNEPYLSSALRLIEELVDSATAAGVPADRIVVTGFSQGACLALEFAARGTRRIGGVVAFAGGLIGPPDVERGALPDQSRVKVFLGCGDMDQHIPIEIAERSAERSRSAGADVDFRRYTGLHHTIVEDELRAGKALITSIVTKRAPD
ncbi:MAG: alpha/beta hydrolase [Chloroflexota bacterium]|nr:alpha/beta hydrolase [Chloroflexota bacterium]